MISKNIFKNDFVFFTGVGPNERRPNKTSRSLSDPSGIREGHDTPNADMRR